jgi:stage II sporulation protein D
LEVIYSNYSNILDRNSLFYSWQVKKSREELEKRINQFYPIGELQDLVPLKRTNSNRVIELLIKGRESQALVKGFKIRRVLGLKEMLFVIDREYDEQGQISYFIFCGKGWGHGVGLCQVGAFGMARAGADYREILKKYYQGIKIGKIY